MNTVIKVSRQLYKSRNLFKLIDSNIGFTENGVKLSYGSYISNDVLIVDYGLYGRSIYNKCHFELGKTYTISADVFLPNDIPDGNFTFEVLNNYVKPVVLKIGQWQKVTFTFTITSDTDYWFMMAHGNATKYQNLNVQIKNIQIELGTEATPFKPYKNNYLPRHLLNRRSVICE